MAVKFGADPGKRGPRVGHRRAVDALRQGRSAEDGGRAPLQGLGDKVAAVGPGSGQGGKQRAGARLPGVAGDGGNVRVLGTVRAHGGQKLGQLHGEDLLTICCPSL